MLREQNRELKRKLALQEISHAQQSMELENTLMLLTLERRMLERVQRAAQYDILTGLPKRDSIIARAEQLLSTGAHPEHRFAILSIGLNRFHRINDTIGHGAGNELLKAVAERIAASLEACGRPDWMTSGWLLARSGGDEFAILLEDVGSLDKAKQISDRIQKNLAAPFRIQGREIFASASAGVVLSGSTYQSPGDQSAEELLRDADTAMYLAKSRRDGRPQVFDSEMRAHALVRWELETDLRHALDRNTLRVYYQPKVLVSTGEVVGFEALLRWEHETRGLIPPLEFIPIAEETGLIIEIGEWVLREACRQIRDWNTRYRRPTPLSVSVNLSSVQFSDTLLFNRIVDAIADTGIDPRWLALEVTESNLLTNSEAVEVLTRLKGLGVGLMIDDFGTGYSSFSYLAQFPFDTLKIDRSFVQAVDLDLDRAEIVRTLLALAATLKMGVIAEGIETTTQLAELRALGCPYGQGYLFSKPLPAQAAEQMLGTLEFCRCEDRNLFRPNEIGCAPQAMAEVPVPV